MVVAGCWHSDRIVEKQWAWRSNRWLVVGTAIKSLGVEANQMDAAIESMVGRDVIAGVHGGCDRDVIMVGVFSDAN